MPHLIYEYTANLDSEIDLSVLLLRSNQLLLAQGDVFPIGGIRSRAIRLEHFCVADGQHDDAFVHLTLIVGAGRAPAVLKKTGDALFAMLIEHFAAIQARRYLALSMEIQEFSEEGTWKSNNIHRRYRVT